jgi:polar amino acid transport system substrate-binding protein
MHNRKSLVIVLALLLAFATLGVVGCGGQDTGTENTGTENTGTETAYPTDYTLVQPGKILVGSDTAFPPFESMNGNVAEGFDVDLMNAIGDELGLQVVFMTEGFDTLIPTVKAGGKFDVIASAMTITDERKQEIDFSDPYIDSNQSIAVRNDFNFTDESSLKGKKVGAQAGTTGLAWAQENIPGADIVEFKTATDALNSLQAGRVDAVVNDLPVTAWLIKDASKGLKIAKEIPTGEQYGFGLSQDNPQLTAAINQALAKLKENGKYDEVYQKWFGAGQ